MGPTRTKWSVIALGLAAIGLGASLASSIDLFAAAPAFCAESGCGAVRESGWAAPLGIPMPVLGIAFFTAAIALGFVAARRGLRRGLAIAGAGWAILLLGVQGLAIGAWCKLCVVADAAAIGYAIAVLAGAGAVRFTLPRVAALAPAVLAALGLVAVWSDPEPASPPAISAIDAAHDDTPAFVAREQRPGIATIVEVVDFECPFCRRLQDRLTEAIAKARQPVRVVRMMLPLPNHPGAMPAALAYCCAEAQGKGEEMAEALFAARPDELTTEGCERIAARIGCDMTRYRDDMAGARRRVTSEAAQAMAAGIDSLPTTYIGKERIVGAGKSVEELTRMIDAVAVR